jgi:hypothetical protein
VKRGRIPIIAAIAALVVVAGVVGFTVWRTIGHRSDGTGPTSSPVALPTTPSPEEQAAAKALAAYNGFREAYVTASAAADVNNKDLATYSVDPVLAQARYDLYQMNQAGLATTGRPTWSPKVTAVDVTAQPNTVKISDCLDITNWKTVNRATGKSASAPGQAQRFTVAAEAFLDPNGRWVLRVLTSDRNTSC